MTVISSYFLSLKPGIDNGTIVPVGAANWLVDQNTYMGYSGAGHAQGVGYTQADPANTAARMPFDISAIPAGVYKSWVRLYALDGNKDSAFMSLDTDAGAFHQIYPNAGQYNQWVWVENPTLTLDGSETTLTLSTREDQFGIDKIIIVDATENAVPDGADGFTGATVHTLDVGTAQQAPPSTADNNHTVNLNAIGLSVTNFTVTSTVAGVTNIVEGAHYESGGKTYFPFDYDTGAAGTGQFDISITADGNTYTGDVALTVVANLPPVIVHPGNQTVDTDNALSLQLSTSDPEGDTFNHFWDDYNPPAGVSLTDTGLVSWQPYKSNVGTETFKIKAVDANGKEGKVEFDVTVTHTDAVPTFSTNGFRVAQVGKLFELQIVATAPDKMQETPVVVFADAYTPPAWLSFAGGYVTGTPAAGDVTASLDIDFKVTLNGIDYGYGTTVEVIDVSTGASNNSPITNVKAVSTAFNTPVTFTVDGSVTDPESDTLVFALGVNGKKGNAVLNDSATGEFTYTPTGEGGDIVTYTVTDGTNTSHGVVDITIGANPLPLPTISGFPPVAQVGVPYSFTLTSTNAASFSDDGALPAGFSLNTATGELTANTPLTAGDYTEKITATNSTGSASIVLNIRVDPPAVIPPGTTVTSGEFLGVYADANDVEREIKFSFSTFNQAALDNVVVVDTDDKQGWEAVHIGSGDEFNFNIPIIETANIAEHVLLRDALRAGKIITLYDPNNLRPHITFPIVGKATSTPVIDDLNKCGKYKMSFKLRRILQ